MSERFEAEIEAMHIRGAMLDGVGVVMLWVYGGLLAMLLGVGVLFGAINVLFDPFTGAASAGPNSREYVCAEYHAGRVKELRTALFGWNGCPPTPETSGGGG